MSNIQIFDNQDFGQIRWLKINNKDYAVGIDVAKALGYKDPNSAITRHCKGAVKHPVPTSSGTQIMNVITEGDIYRLTAKSELPQAEKFEEWVFDEILPSIRKYGRYATEELLNNPDLLIKAAAQLEEEKLRGLEAEKKVQIMVPKAEFYDDVARSKDAIEMSDVAKVLAIKGLGRNKLFELLRERKILQPNNIPYQQYVDREYFRVLEQKYTTSKGETKINFKTLVFQKGVDYIRKLVNEVMPC